MQLFQSWKDSLKFFMPDNFRLFALVSLNAMIQTYYIWFKTFWLIFLVSIFADIFHIAHFFIGPIHTSIGGLTSIIAKSLLFMSLFLSVRASVKKKTYKYFFDYRLHIFFIVFVIFVKTLVYQIITGVGPFIADFFGLFVFSPLYVSVVTIFMSFYLDSKGSFIDLFLSWWRFVKMFFYNFPFFLIATVVFAPLVYIVVFILFYIVAFIFGLSFFLVHPIHYGKWVLFFWSIEKHLYVLLSVPLITIITNFYIKRIHEQFKLYF